MSDSKQIIPEKIHIQGIRILGGRIGADVEGRRNLQISSFNIRYAVRDELVFSKKLFRFIFSVDIDSVDSAGQSLGINAQYSIEFIFFVENIKDYVTEKDDNAKYVLFNPILPSTLLSIVYSTSRGIILSRTQGTSMEGVVLPVIEIQTLLKAMEAQRKLEVSTK